MVRKLRLNEDANTLQEIANVALNDAKLIFRDITNDDVNKQELLVDATHLINVLKEMCKILESDIVK